MEQVNLLVVVVGVLIVVVPAFAFFILWWTSFKYTARIARQVGNDPTNVIWTTERFKVKNEDGLFILVFRNLKEKSPNYPGNMWSRFLEKKYIKKTLRIPKEDWEKQNIKTKIHTGLHLYETEKGDLLPMIITVEEGVAKFKVLNQEQRWFAIKAIRDANSLTRDKKREMIATIVLIAGLIVFGIVFVLGMVYLNENSKQGLIDQTAACRDIIQTIFNPNNQTGGPQFLNNMLQPTVGG